MVLVVIQCLCQYPPRIRNYGQRDTTSFEYPEAKEMPQNGQENHSIKNL